MDAFWDFVGSWTFILILVAVLFAIVIAVPLIIFFVFMREINKRKRSNTGD
jgi:hypothetical protein